MKPRGLKYTKCLTNKELRKLRGEYCDTDCVETGKARAKSKDREEIEEQLKEYYETIRS